MWTPGETELLYGDALQYAHRAKQSYLSRVWSPSLDDYDEWIDPVFYGTTEQNKADMTAFLDWEW